MRRREFMFALGAGAAGVLVARRAHAQEDAPQRTGNLFMDMNESAYKPVTLAAKPNAKPSMSVLDRDALEHRIHCQCGCVLDVYTCRTTDFSCSVSPAMHRDVMTLVAGGYSAQEIIDAFRTTYGERVLMEPTRNGFNWLAWVTPFVALGAGATFLAVLMKKWGARAQVVAAKTAAIKATRAMSEPAARPGDATDAELAAINAAVRAESSR